MALAALAALPLAGCDPSDAEGPGSSGPLTVTLVSPNGMEGAALFELPVDGVLEVKAPVGLLVESRVGDSRQVALFASQPTAPLTLQLTVADQTHPPAVRLLQVSGPEDQSRSLAGYSVQVAVPK